jgi:hypothetical protein
LATHLSTVPSRSRDFQNIDDNLNAKKWSFCKKKWRFIPSLYLGFQLKSASLICA